MSWEAAQKLMVSKAAEDRLWAYLELQQDLVFSRLSSGERLRYVDGALELGSQWASQFKTPNLLEAVQRRGIAIRAEDLGKNVRASYSLGVITLNTSALEKILHLLPPSFLTLAQLERATIAHEFFHYLEEDMGSVDLCFPTVTVLRLGPWRVRKARVRAVREIAAHRFAKELAALPCLPSFFDWLWLAWKSPEFRETFPGLAAEVGDLLKKHTI